MTEVLTQIIHLCWYLSWYLIGSNRMLVWLLSVSEKVSKEYQRQRNAKPHCHNPKNGEEGNCSTGVFAPNEQVDEESDTKYN